MSILSKQLFSYDNLVHAVAGAAGSIVAMTVFYPLDTVRIRLQLEDERKAENTWIVMRELVAEEGVLTLYRGIVPVLQSICASNFVYFYCYHGLKTALARKSNNHLLMATLAGAINVLITGPLWLVATRMKMSGINNGVSYDSLFDGLEKVVRYEGLGKLWSGTLPSLILVSNPAIHMAVYEYLKKRVRSDTALAYFILSALAKMSATFATYPIQLAQAKQRHGQSAKKFNTSLKMIPVLISILRQDGPVGLFKGMEAKLLQTVLTTALMFMTYEKIAYFVFKIMKGR